MVAENSRKNVFFVWRFGVLARISSSFSTSKVVELLVQIQADLNRPKGGKLVGIGPRDSPHYMMHNMIKSTAGINAVWLW